MPSHCNRLPVELLAHIFVFVVRDAAVNENDGEHSLPFNTDTVTAPLALSCVSRHWRRVANSTPALWSSICLTTDDVGRGFAHLPPLLERSKNASIDVLLDSRDPEWDFTEPESPLEEDQLSDYVPPFTSDHMRRVLDLLMPHVARFRSLTVLTDTWAPMRALLTRLHYAPAAPRLEILSLMRCNECAAHGSAFDIPNAVFLAETDTPFALFGGASLPRLRSLTLSGAHVDWTALATAIPLGLEELELSYHALTVRPSEVQLQAMLERCPAVTTMTINVSGSFTSNGFTPVSLPRLQKLVVGFTDAWETATLLSSFNAPGVTTLSLEDATLPIEYSTQIVEWDPDAACLLNYIATGGIRDVWPQATKRTAPILSSPAPPLATAIHPPFPVVHDLTLTKIQSCTPRFHDTFDAMPQLQRLFLDSTSSDAARALLDESVCPSLAFLSVKGFEEDVEMEMIVERLADTRKELKDVELHVSDEMEVGVWQPGENVEVEFTNPWV